MSDDQPLARDRFMFFSSYRDAIADLPDPADQLATFWAIVNYGLDGVEPEKGIARAIFRGIKPAIDNSRKLSRVRTETGKLGGRPSGNQTETKPKPNHNQTITKPKPNGNQTITKPKPNHKQTETVEESRVEESRVVEGSGVESRVVEVASGDAVVPHKETSKENRPKPKRSQLTTTKSASTLRELYPDAMAFWDSVRQVYPSHRRHQPSEGTLQLIEREGLIDREQEILNKIIAFTQKDDGWKRGFVPRMSKFFERGLYENDPTPPRPPEVRVIQTIHTSKPPQVELDPNQPQDLPL